MPQDLLTLISDKNIIIFVLVLTRISAMLSTAPFFSTFPMPMQVKAMLAALTAFCIYPFIASSAATVVPTEMLTLTILLLRELFIGVLIGFCANLIFSAVQLGGQLLSIQMGLSVSNVLDPVTQQHVPIVGQFYLFIASMMFLYISGHHYLFNGIAESYNVLPIAMSFAMKTGITEKIISMTSMIFSLSFSLVLPIYGILFITDIALGFVSKMMPQMNIFMVSLPLKIYAGLLLLMLFIPTTAVYLAQVIQSSLQSIIALFI